MYTRTKSPARGRAGATRVITGTGPRRGPAGVPMSAADVVRAARRCALDGADVAQRASVPQCSHWFPRADHRPPDSQVAVDQVDAGGRRAAGSGSASARSARHRARRFRGRGSAPRTPSQESRLMRRTRPRSLVLCTCTAARTRIVAPTAYAGGVVGVAHAGELLVVAVERHAAEHRRRRRDRSGAAAALAASAAHSRPPPPPPGSP